jgi:hypothetical protein
MVLSLSNVEQAAKTDLESVVSFFNNGVLEFDDAYGYRLREDYIYVVNPLVKYIHELKENSGSNPICIYVELKSGRLLDIGSTNTSRDLNKFDTGTFTLNIQKPIINTLFPVFSDFPLIKYNGSDYNESGIIFRKLLQESGTTNIPISAYENI